ncbi:MAG: hypothetical protein HY392_02135 [Candidatus Diapherotrites archaeon]|nr:hypothetical protein [Candidatus Diapherotrites archaeon]
MAFVNTLPYVSNPIEEFSDFKFVNWEKDIYPKFKGGAKKEERDFFLELITKNNLKSIIDFEVGGGTELSRDFTIEKVYHDFGEEQKEKSLFVQFLARRK